MQRGLLSFLVLFSFFFLFMLYPLGHVLLRAFVVGGLPSLRYFVLAVGSETFRDIICNSLNIAITVTVITSLVAYPIAFLLTRWRIPLGRPLHALLLMPLVVPPFVGVLGVRALLGRFGTLNMFLINRGVITEPLDILGAGNVAGIIALQVIHLVPVMYLSISASLQSAQPALEEAAAMAGASRFTIVRRIVLPLSYPGWFAGAVLVFVASFTDLGTPLLFEYRHVLPVQIFDMLSDVNENPVGYSFVVITCALCLILFYSSRGTLMQGSYSSGGRISAPRKASQKREPVHYVVALALCAYLFFSLLPHIGVTLLAVSDDWFMSELPTRYTLKHFAGVLAHPLTARSLINSISLSLVASLLAVIVGYASAYTIVRTRIRGRWLLEILTILPLAVPGIVFAFGYIGAFSGTILDNRVNPFPLLIAAYIVRRTPSVVRSATAGLQEASVSLEEAALLVGASPMLVSRRIVFPLIRRHLAVGAILTFAYSMLEVSDGLLLAMEERFYPVSKAMYALMARPDGLELASALGLMLTGLMLSAFAVSDHLVSRPSRRNIATVVCVIAAATTLLSPHTARAEDREIVAVSPHWEGIRREFERSFSKRWRESTGESVTFRWLDVGGTSDILRYIKTQFIAQPAGIGIDLMFGGGTDSFLELSGSGYLEPLKIKEEIFKAIPKDVAGVPLYSAKLDWFAAALSTFGILYNKVAIDKLGLPVPETWADLEQPSYFNLIGAGDPRKSGSMHAMYEIVLQGYGWEAGWHHLQKIAGNVRNFSGGGTNVGKEIANAEVVYGLAIDTYAGELIRRIGSDRLGYAVPKDYAAVNGDAIAVLKGAPNRRVAAAFVEFILSDEGQRIWYARRGQPGGPEEFEIGKMPILPSLYGTVPTASVVEGSPFQWRSALTFNAEQAANRYSAVNDLFGVFIIDIHDRLVSLAGPSAHPHDLAAFPITELEISKLRSAGAWTNNAALRSATIREWNDRARAIFPPPKTVWSHIKWLPPLALLTFTIGAVVRTRRGTLR